MERGGEGKRERRGGGGEIEYIWVIIIRMMIIMTKGGSNKKIHLYQTFSHRKNAKDAHHAPGVAYVSV